VSRKPPSPARLAELRDEVFAAIHAAGRPVSLAYLEGEICAHHAWIRLALEVLAADGLVEQVPGYRGRQAWSVRTRTSSDERSESSGEFVESNGMQPTAIVQVPADFIERFVALCERQARQLSALLDHFGIDAGEHNDWWDAWERDKPSDFGTWVTAELYRRGRFDVGPSDGEVN